MRNLALEISDDLDEARDVLGAVKPAFIGDCYNDPVDVASDEWIISIANAKNVTSDEACCAIIAHEFAHIVLRHLQYSKVVACLINLGIYTSEYYDSLNDIHEETADLLVWTWGFKQEYLALLDEYPNSFRPKWLVKIEDDTKL